MPDGRRRIVERIRALRALARDRGATSHEAKLAAERAAELQAKYGISDEELGDLERPGESRFFMHFRDHAIITGRSAALGQQFPYIVARPVGTRLGCIGLNCGDGVIFWGVYPLTVAAHVLLEYLKSEIERWLAIYMTWRRRRKLSRADTFIYSFRVGISTGLLGRLDRSNERHYREEVEPEGQEVVENDLQAGFDEVMGTTTSVPLHERERDEASFRAGYEAAKKINLHPGKNRLKAIEMRLRLRCQLDEPDDDEIIRLIGPVDDKVALMPKVTPPPRPTHEAQDRLWSRWHSVPQVQASTVVQPAGHASPGQSRMLDRLGLAFFLTLLATAVVGLTLFAR